MKGANYFAHDYGARNDDKILAIRERFGNEGYALFFYCLETMAENGNGYLIAPLIGGLSISFVVEKKTLEDFLNFCCDIEIFCRNDVGFYSPRMIEHLDFRKKLKKHGKDGAKKRWTESEKNSPPNAPPHSNKRKEKKKKENKYSISSKEEIEPQAVQKFGNEEINKMLLFLKQTLKIEDFAESQKWQRIYAQHMRTLGERIGREVFLKRLVALMQDKFHKKNCNKIKYLYEQIKSYRDVSNIQHLPGGYSTY